MNKNACPCEGTVGVCIVVRMCGCAVLYPHRNAIAQLRHHRRLRSHHRIILQPQNIVIMQPHILAVAQHRNNTTAEICNHKDMQLHNNITAKP